MKKFFISMILVFCLSFALSTNSFSYVTKDWGDPYGTVWEMWSGDYGFGITPGTGEIYFYVKTGGEISFYDTRDVTTDSNRFFRSDLSGTTSPGFYTENSSTGKNDFYVPTDRVVTINAASQLSTWSNLKVVSGQSYYQMAPGKIYLVDPYAIANSVVNGVSVFDKGAVGFSGVTLVLPDASVYSGPGYDVEVRFVVGNDGFTQVASGGTVVYVVPYAGSGATAYNAWDSKAQSMMTKSGASGFTVTAPVCGKAFSLINAPGEAATFSLANSSVSAYPVRVDLTN